MKKALLLGLLPLFLYHCAEAQLSEHAFETISISADNATEDELPGVLHFDGHFQMRSEDWELFSSSATVYGSPNKPDRVYLEGSPASFIVNRVEQVPQGPVAATAAVVEYRRDENKLTLSGDARLELGDEVIRSKYIEYDIENNRYQAGGVDRVSIEVIPTK